MGAGAEANSPTRGKVEWATLNLVSEVKAEWALKEKMASRASEAFEAADVMRNRVDGLVADRDAALLERDAALKERDLLSVERDAVLKERDVVLKERDAVVNDGNEALAAAHAQVQAATLLHEKERSRWRVAATRVSDATLATVDAIYEHREIERLEQENCWMEERKMLHEALGELERATAHRVMACEPERIDLSGATSDNEVGLDMPGDLSQNSTDYENETCAHEAVSTCDHIRTVLGSGDTLETAPDLSPLKPRLEAQPQS